MFVSFYVSHIRILCAAILLTAAQSFSAAAWEKYESDNFIVYSELKEKRTRYFIGQLEKYRQFLIEVAQIEPLADSLKLTIYIPKSQSRYTALTKSRGSVGLFQLTATKPLSVFFDIGSGKLQKSTQVLFHEYVHYMQFQGQPTYYPLWYREGFAEYLSSVKWVGDQTHVGEILWGRAQTLHISDWLTAKTLLEAKRFPKRGYTFYPQSWLLSHMLYTNRDYIAGRTKFLQLLADEIDPKSALDIAYGISFDQLDQDMHKYYDEGKFYANIFPAAKTNYSVSGPEKYARDDNIALDLRLQLDLSFNEKQFEKILDKIQSYMKRRESWNKTLTPLEIEALIGIKRWKTARRKATEALEEDPHNSALLALMGEIIISSELSTRGDETKITDFVPAETTYVLGQKYLLDAIAKDASNIRALAWYAKSLLDRSNPDFTSAKPAVEAAYRLYPQSWTIRRQYTDLLFANGSIETACVLYKALHRTTENKHELSHIEAKMRVGSKTNDSCIMPSEQDK